MQHTFEVELFAAETLSNLRTESLSHPESPILTYAFAIKSVPLY